MTSALGGIIPGAWVSAMKRLSRVLKLSTWRCPECIKKLPLQESCAEASTAAASRIHDGTLLTALPQLSNEAGNSFCYCKQRPVGNLQFAKEAIEIAGVVRQLIIGARDDMLKWQQTFDVWG